MPTASPTSGLSLRHLAERDPRVFPSYPQVARYFGSAAIEDARGRLARAIDRGDGPGLVIGAPGTGKSLLLQVLAAQYQERFDVVLLACARICTRRALLQAVLFELGLPYKLRDEGELRLSLLDHLLSEEDCPAGLLLLVDEAQTLPVPLLDELRVMTNLVRKGAPRVQLVLAGCSALEESFAHPELESFSQRLSARCYLAPFSRDETTQFIRAQVAAAGGAPDELFVGDAWDAVFEATDGVPRLVNQLCDRALLAAVAEGRSHIDRQVVQAAWSELQQLPAPWDMSPSSLSAPAASQVVEFGGLSDEVPGFREGEAPAEPPYENIQLGGSLALPSSGTTSAGAAMLDIEPTELDDDEQEIATVEPVVGRQQEERTVDAVAADPFAEEFDEEEVVLDNFAAWDDIFRRDMPRVENRRDPGFATLVQTAIEASPVTASAVVDSPALGSFCEFDTDEFITKDEENTEATEVNEPAETEAATGWPGLRLAVVTEPVARKPIPVTATAPPQADEAGMAATRSEVMPVSPVNDSAREPVVSENPVLVIEEDSAVASNRPTVRREEYRDLFSRLRDG